MDNNSLIEIEKPVGLDAKFAASGGGDHNALKALGIQAAPEQVGKPLDIDSVMTDEVRQSMVANALKRSNRSTPNETKYVDKQLTSRYGERPVSYNDIGLDTTFVDAKYSKTQSVFDTSLNNLKVGAANLGSMFAASFLGLGDILNNIRSGQNAADSPLMDSLFKMRENVANNNINFQNEQDAKTDAWSTIKNAILPSALSGSTTGWGSIFENAMFGVGAGLGIATQEALVSFVAPGVGNSAVLARFAATTLNNLDRIRKTATLADRIYDTSQALNNVTRTLDVTNKVLTGAKWGYRLGVGAHGEAAFEALETKHQLSATLKQQFIDEHGYAPSGKDLELINKITDDTSQNRYLANVALLMATGSVGYGRLFRGFDLAKDTAEQLAKQGLRVTLDAEGKVVAKRAGEITSDWWNRGFQKNLKPVAERIKAIAGADLVKESFTEGGEEWAQLTFDEIGNSYAAWKLNHNGQSSINAGIKAVQEGIGNSFNTKGLGAWISGAISGVAQQASFAAASELKNSIDPNGVSTLELSKQKQKELQDTLDKYQGFNINNAINAFNVNSVRGSATSRALSANAIGTANKVAESSLDANDVKGYKDAESVNLFSLIEPYAARGHSDILKQQFAFAIEGVADEDIASMSGSPISKADAVSKFNASVDSVNKAYSQIKSAFKNPYSVNNPNYTIFENEFLGELAFLKYRTDDLNKRKGELEFELGDYYSDFRYFTDEKNLKKGRKFLEDELKNAEQDLAYDSSLPDKEQQDYETNRKKKLLVDQYNRAIEKLDEFENSENNRDAYDEFIDSVHQTLITKYDRLDDGSFAVEREQILQKITDFDRINDDLDSVDKMLRSYVAKDGFGLFVQGFAAEARRQQRKRDLFEKSEEIAGLAPIVQEKAPTLTPEEVVEVIENSTSVEDAIENAEQLEKDKAERAKLDQEIKDAIREEFVKLNRGDHAETFLAGLKPTTLKEDMKKAHQYIDSLTTMTDRHNKVLEGLVTKLKPLGTFVPDGLSNYITDKAFSPENLLTYNTLSNENKIKFSQDVIAALKIQNIMSGSTTTKYRDNIALYEQNIKDLKAEIPKEFESYNESYGQHIITYESPTKASISTKDGVYVDTVDSKDAKSFIDNRESEEQQEDDALSEGEANLANKFENGYFEPDWYDENGIPREHDNQNIFELFGGMNEGFEGLSKSEIEESLAENVTAKFYDESDITQVDINADQRPDESDDDYQRRISAGQLVNEPILRSLTTRAIVLNYTLPDGTQVPLNTRKDPVTDLQFMPDHIVEQWLKTKKIFNDTSIAIILKAIPASRTYYDFLKQSINNPGPFEMLNEVGLINFKGSIQEQFDEITQRKKVFDKLVNIAQNGKKISDEFQIKRLFYGINKRKRGTYPINQIQYPFAALAPNSDSESAMYRTFVRIPRDYKIGDDIEFIGLPSDVQADAFSKVTQAFTSLYKDKPVTNGYYMLTTDSAGNPAVHLLVTKAASRGQVYESFQRAVDGSGKVLEGVAIIDTSGQLRYVLTKKNNQLSVGVEKIETGEKTFFTYKITQDSVKTLRQNIVTDTYKLKTQWQNAEGEIVKDFIRPVGIEVKAVISTSGKPNSTQEIMDTRDVLSINPFNYSVNKLEFIERNNAPIKVVEVAPQEVEGVPEIKPEETFDPIEVDEELSDADFVNDIAARENISLTAPRDFPTTISPTDIADIAVEIHNLLPNSDIAQIVKAIVVAGNIRLNATKGTGSTNLGGATLYLSDIDTIKGALPQLEALINNIDTLRGPMIAALSKANIGNLFTLRESPKTRLSFEDRVQEIIKQCIR